MAGNSPHWGETQGDNEFCPTGPSTDPQTPGFWGAVEFGAAVSDRNSNFQADFIDEFPELFDANRKGKEIEILFGVPLIEAPPRTATLGLGGNKNPTPQINLDFFVQENIAVKTGFDPMRRVAKMISSGPENGTFSKFFCTPALRA